MQAQIKTAMAPLSAVASTVQNNFSPAQPISVLKPVDYGTQLGSAYNNGKPYTEQTITTPAGGPIVAGGNAQEASRGAQLVSTYGADQVIGSTAGFGVRQTGPIAGSVSAGNELSDIYDSNSGYRTSATAAAPKTSSSLSMNERLVEMGKIADKAYQEGRKMTPKESAAYKEFQSPGSTAKHKLAQGAGTAITTSAGTGFRHA
jgi:hypothetical protein